MRDQRTTGDGRGSALRSSVALTGFVVLMAAGLTFETADASQPSSQGQPRRRGATSGIGGNIPPPAPPGEGGPSGPTTYASSVEVINRASVENCLPSATRGRGPAIQRPARIEAPRTIGRRVKDRRVIAPPPCPQLPGGVDHTAAGVGLRNTGSGTIALRGVPVGSTAVRGWLTWAIITRHPQSLANRTATFNGQTVVGKLVGVTSQPCWSDAWQASFAVYRADVTSRLLPGMNGDYLVGGVQSQLTDGRDPFRGSGDNGMCPLAEGASLLVVYANADIPDSATVYIHDVLAPLNEVLDVYHLLEEPLPDFSQVKHTRLGGDGQRTHLDRGVFPLATELEGSGGNATQIRGPGSPIDPYSDWQGLDGGSVQQLWDTQVSELPAFRSPLYPGELSYVIRYDLAATPDPMVASGYQFDCVVVVTHILGVR